MNLSLIDPFVLAQDYPDSLTGKLSTQSLEISHNILLANLPIKEVGMQPVYASTARGIFLLLEGSESSGAELTT